MLKSSLFFAIVYFASLVACVDYYQVLQVNKDANEKEIKSAYRKLSLQYHPDKNPGNQEAAQKFLEIQKAHDVLSDPELRRIYDLQGIEGLERREKGGDNNPWIDRRRGPAMGATATVSLEELYSGAVREMNLNKNVICPSCRGTGAKDGKTQTCKHCGGRGVRMERVQVGIGFNMQMQVHCNACGGTGKTIPEACPKCGGRRVVPESKKLRIDIEKGMRDGQKIVFERESEQHPDYTPGDVVVTVKQEPHPRFTRVGDNLYYDCPLSMKEALLGFSKTVKHLDHHYTEIAIQDIVQPFSVKVIKDQGMPIHNQPFTFGDMHVKFKVGLPKELSEQDRELLTKIFAMDSS